MSESTADTVDSDILLSVVDHVFMPPMLPQKGPDEEIEQQTNVALCNSLIEVAQEFLQTIPSSESSLWMHMIKMMELTCCTAKSPFKKAGLRRTLSDMVIGGTST
jgi:hypothetical protein